MLLSESYRALNTQLHEDPTYGVSGERWSKYVLSICEAQKTFDVLDYGSGKKTLETALGFPIKNYDP